jgi:hypothetical protein
VSEKELSLNIVMKSQADQALQGLSSGLKALSEEAKKISVAFKEVTFGKNDNPNHPDSMNKKIQTIHGSVGGLHKEVKDLNKTMAQDAPRAMAAYQMAMQKATGGSGVSGYGSGRFGSNLGVTAGMSGGFGGQGGGPPPPSWFQSNGGWGSVRNGMMSGLQGGNNLLGAAGSMFSAYGQYETAEKLGGLRNKVASDTGFNQMMSMARNAPPGYLAAILGQGQGYASGNKSDSAVDILKGTGKVRTDKFGTGVGILNTGADNDEDIRAQKAGDTVSSISGFANNILNMFNGVKAGGSVNQAVGSAAKSMAGNAGAIGTSGIKTAGVFQDTQQGGIDAAKGRQMTETLNLLSNTASGRALMDSYSTAHSTAQIRLHGSRSMGGEGNALGMFGTGGNLGFDAAQTTGLVSGLRGQFGGRAAMGIAPQAMQMANKGFDLHSAGAMLGQMGESGPGGAAMMEKVMAAGIKQGMSSLDVMFFQKIGEAVASNSVGRNGSTGSISGALYSAGVGNDEQTMRKIKGNVAGLELGNQIQQGNPFFSSRNLVNASSMLGGNASIRARETFGNASIEDLAAIKGGTAGEDNALSIRGITPEQATQQLDFMVNNYGSVLTGAGDESDPLVKIIKEGEKKHGSFGGALSAAMKGKDSKFMNATKQLGQETLGGAGSEAFGGMTRVFGAAVGGNIEEFMSGKGNIGDVSSKSGKQDVAVETKKMLNEISIFLKNLKESSDKYGNNLSKTQDILESLQASAGKVTYNATEVALTAASVNIDGTIITVNNGYQEERVSGKTNREFGAEGRKAQQYNVEQASGKTTSTPPAGGPRRR